jgi:predicted Zn-dependent protease
MTGKMFSVIVVQGNSSVLEEGERAEQRLSGSLTVLADSFTVETGQGTFLFPLEGVSLAPGGANNSLLFISHPSFPDLSIYCRDKELLQALGKTGEQGIEGQLRHIQVHRRRGLRTGFMAIFIIMAGLYALNMLRGPIAGLIADFVPKSWERGLGEVSFTVMRNSISIIDDDDLQKQFEVLIAPVLKVAEESGYTFEVHISREQGLNAFALPGGVMVVNAGTILKAGRLEELLGVLAHEVSHVTKRHATRQLISMYGIYFFVDLVFGGMAGTLTGLSQGALFLVQQGFSRENEEEADLQGLRYLEKAQIDPNGMVEFFERVKEETEKDPLVSAVEKRVEILSTHPATDSRIAYLRDRILVMPRWKYAAPNQAQFELLKETLREKVF